MANKLFKSFFALAMVVGSALGFASCETVGDVVVADPTVEVSTTSLNFTQQEGSQIVEIIANSDWKVGELDADWVTVTPMNGNGDGVITVAVATNDTGAIRKATIKVYAMHKTYGEWGSKKIEVTQSASNEVPVTEELIYGDNFDGKEATKTYGSGSSWPWIDEFPEFVNASGPAAENVKYTGNGVSVRSNSNSNSDYSDYAGSGMNNIFFGSSAYFQVHNIALDAAQAGYKLTFGSEKYSQDNGSIFTNSEFHVYLSKNGNGWQEIEYTFAGTAEGRWNLATAEFTLTEVPEKLYIKFVVDVASSYRLDDVMLYIGNGGQSVTLPEEGGGDGGNNEPVVTDGIYASDAAFVCAEDNSENAAYGLGDTKIGSNAVTGFKLGKSKQAGKFTSAAVGVSGDKYLNFYAVGWKGGDVTLYYRVDGGATQSQKLVANNGATGNSPYTALSFAKTDHYSVKLTGLKETSTIEFSTDANFALTSAEATMPSARAIVCGVKLSDEPIEGEDGGNVAPEPTPGGSMTIAEAIAAADNTSVVIENATVIGVYSRGALLEDKTGKILAYAGSAVSVNVGDVVKAEGTVTTYGGLRQIGGTVTLTKTGTTTYTYPAEKTMDGAAFDAYLNSPVIEYVKYTGTLKIDGYYYNVTIDGASTAVGSLAYVIDGTVDPSLDGQKIDVRGWTIGFSGGKFVNTMIRSVVAAGTTPAPDPDPTPDPTPDPVDAVKVTVAQFLAAAEDATIYELTGVIKNVANTNYGNFDLQDETGVVYVYGLYDESGSKVFTSLGLKEGDTLTLRGVRSSYNDEPQVGSGVYVSHVSAPVQEQPANEATLSFTDLANRVSFDSNKQVWSANGITLTNNKGASTSNIADYHAPARFYKSSEIIVECDKAMSKIVFACNSASYASALQASLGSTPSTIDGSSVTVELDTAKTSFTIASLTGGQVRMNSLTVTFAE